MRADLSEVENNLFWSALETFEGVDEFGILKNTSNMFTYLFAFSKWAIPYISFIIKLPDVCIRLDGEAVRLLHNTLYKQPWAIFATQ